MSSGDIVAFGVMLLITINMYIIAYFELYCPTVQMLTKIKKCVFIHSYNYSLKNAPYNLPLF